MAINILNAWIVRKEEQWPGYSWDVSPLSPPLIRVRLENTGPSMRQIWLGVMGGVGAPETQVGVPAGKVIDAPLKPHTNINGFPDNVDGLTIQAQDKFGSDVSASYTMDGSTPPDSGNGGTDPSNGDGGVMEMVRRNPGIALLGIGGLSIAVERASRDE